MKENWKVEESSSGGTVWGNESYPNLRIILNWDGDYPYYIQKLENGRYVSGEVMTFKTLEDAISEVERWKGSDEELEAAIGAKTKELTLKACAFYHITPKGLDMMFSKTGRAGGCAGYNEDTGRYYLDFNWELARKNPDEYLQQIIGHEVAHIINDWLHPGKNDHHGYNWQCIMVKCFGLMPDRCHHMETTGQYKPQERKHIYECPSCHFQYHLKQALHSRIASGKRGATCSQCYRKSVLVYKGQKNPLLDK